jgi:predicted 3-demethylubiquinone-9 3-methyltransferase (glyoxalase superfamily)
MEESHGDNKMKQNTKPNKLRSQRKSNMKESKQKITTCLWFDSQAEEAANFYVSIFDNSKILSISRYDKASAGASGQPDGSVLTVDFELNGQRMMALNGGPIFKFTEAISLTVDCKTQEEVDHFWNRLTSDGGEESMCGWLKDKYGLSWQIVPSALGGWMRDKDKQKSGRVMQKLLTMRKLDIAALQRAYDGK